MAGFLDGTIVRVKSEGKSSRILTFDLLRGYFMVSIILNHLQRYPNGLDWVAMRGWLFVSAAEGFFMVSGIVLGIVRGAKLKDKPFRIAAWLIFKRGLQLYVWTVALVLLYTLIGWQFLDAPRLKPGIYPVDAPVSDLIWRALTLQYVYGWADFLRFYTFFLLVSPLALWLLRAQLWYALLFISWLLWLVVPLYSALEEPWKWQVLFFTGLTVGYHWKDLTAWWLALALKYRRLLIGGVLGASLVTFSINMFLLVGPKLVPPEMASQLLVAHAQLVPFFDKPSVAPARLALFFLWFSSAFYIFYKLEAIIVRFLGWLLLAYGQNSLYVYILHSFFVFMLDIIVPTRQLLLNIVISFSTLGIIWLLTKKRFLMNIIPR